MIGMIISIILTFATVRTNWGGINKQIIPITMRRAAQYIIAVAP
jgi:hypothetical protein